MLESALGSSGAACSFAPETATSAGADSLIFRRFRGCGASVKRHSWWWNLQRTQQESGSSIWQRLLRFLQASHGRGGFEMGFAWVATEG
jgi:hypothetical protein